MLYCKPTIIYVNENRQLSREIKSNSKDDIYWINQVPYKSLVKILV